jgi:hypothetical protein
MQAQFVRQRVNVAEYGSIRVPRVFCLLANSRRRDRSRIDAVIILSPAHTPQLTRPPKNKTRGTRMLLYGVADPPARLERRELTKAFRDILRLPKHSIT